VRRNNDKESSTVGDEGNSRPAAFHRMTLAEFARLSSSRQLMLLAIRKAQLSSGKALMEAAAARRRADASPGDSSSAE
jgi:hypothetical protein